MKNRLTAIFLALLLVSGLTAPARAQSQETAGQGNGFTLTGAETRVFNRLKEEAGKVADGTRANTTFEIDLSGAGVTRKGNELNGLDMSAVLRVMLAECPYELYWFDKVKSPTSSFQYNSSSGVVSSLTVQLAVSQDYAVISADGNSYYQYQADTKKTGAAAAAVKNAQALVDESSGLSDYEKLLAYRDYICGQTAYNDAAGSAGYPYGDPWQLVYVFDGDPNTNVVCEGYAKAFQYLCSLTDFSNAVECYIVTGATTGNHMWNVVQINGKSYLVDVTNSDTGNLGAYGGLFLAGADNATADGYTISIPRHDFDDGRFAPAASITYTYDTETKLLYGADVLTIAASGYDPAADAAPQAPAFTDVPGWCAPAVEWAVGKGLTNGTGGTSFSPSRPCTHTQILTFLYRANRGGGTADAGDADKAVAWAKEEGIIDEDFNGSVQCTRADAVKYIWQAMGSEAPKEASGFTDVSPEADCAGAVGWAVELGVTNGYANGDGSYAFHPDTVCSRGVIVTLLHRAYVEEARLDAA